MSAPRFSSSCGARLLVGFPVPDQVGLGLSRPGALRNGWCEWCGVWYDDWDVVSVAVVSLCGTTVRTYSVGCSRGCHCPHPGPPVTEIRAPSPRPLLGGHLSMLDRVARTVYGYCR